jgi:hypothetical protein
MEKRYQVFVSSTFVDLIEERKVIMNTLMEMDCFPAGMELFPATDQEQFEFIKKIIDECDYYILLIGGRYGSTTEDGLSYTEKEFDYAVSKNIPVVAFIHGDADNIKVRNTDLDAEKQIKLKQFIEKVATDRLVRKWTDCKELAGFVSLSMNKTIKTHPAVGWIRADTQVSQDVMSKYIKLQEELEQYKSKLGDLDESAQRNSHINMCYVLRLFESGGGSEYFEIEIKIVDFLLLISDKFYIPNNEENVIQILYGYLSNLAGEDHHLSKIYSRCNFHIKTVYELRMIMKSLNLIRCRNMAVFTWTLTDLANKIISSELVQRRLIAPRD